MTKICIRCAKVYASAPHWLAACRRCGNMLREATPMVHGLAEHRAAADGWRSNGERYSRDGKRRLRAQL